MASENEQEPTTAARDAGQDELTDAALESAAGGVSGGGFAVWPPIITLPIGPIICPTFPVPIEDAL